MLTRNFYGKRKETNCFISEYYKLLIKIFQNLISIRKYLIQNINTFNEKEKKDNNKEIIKNKLDCIFDLYKCFHCTYFCNKEDTVKVSLKHGGVTCNSNITGSVINYNNFIKKSKIFVKIYKKMRNKNGIDEYFLCIEYRYNNLKFYKEKKYKEDPSYLDLENICIILFGEFLKLQLPVKNISQLPINLIIETDDSESAILLASPVISFDYFRMKIKQFYIYWGNEKKIVEEINNNIANIKHTLNCLNYNYYILNSHNLD